MAKFNLKESIKADYGFDVPISGGVGLTEDDAIVIDTFDEIDAPNIEWRVIDCVSRSLESAWFLYDKKISKHHDKLIEKVTIAVNYYKNNEPVKVVRDYYFDISSVKFNEIPIYTYFPTVYIDPKSKVAIPFQFGWLNFREYFDNEKDNAGDGMTFTYACPMIKGTLYIYNKGLDKIDMHENRNLMVDEFEESAGQIDGEESESELFNTVDFNNFLTRAYVVDGLDSFIIFTVINNYFFKFRVTLIDDPLAKEMILHVIEQVRHILNQYHHQRNVN
jgi:hypothetical protein